MIYHGIAPFTAVQNEKSPLVQKYILCIGRIERKKNVEGLINAFEIIKEKYQIPHKLVLAGGPGYLFEEVKKKIDASPSKQDIILTGHLQENQKNVFLKFADLFVFPSFYEGLGFPILEAQAAEVPVIASNVSSLPEVAGEGALFFDPADFENISGKIEDKFSVVHVGTIYGATRNPSGFLTAFDDFLSTEGVNPELCRAIFAGNMDRFNLGVVEEKMKNFRHKSCFIQIPYIAHEECIKLLYSSSVLLLIEGDSKSLTGKVFEYLAAGRPILALAAENSPVAQLIKETASGTVLELTDSAKIKDCLLKLYADFKARGSHDNKNSALIKKFSRKELTKQLTDIIKAILEGDGK